MRWDDGFTFPGILSRVVFGSGTLAQIGTEIERLGRSKPLVLSTPHQEPQAQALAKTLGAKLCHVLGGSFGTPHAETHAILIPHTAGFNAVAVPEKLAGVAEVFGSVGPGLWGYSMGLGAPLAQRDLGLSGADLDRAAQIAVQTPMPIRGRSERRISGCCCRRRGRACVRRELRVPRRMLRAEVGGQPPNPRDIWGQKNEQVRLCFMSGRDARSGATSG